MPTKKPCTRKSVLKLLITKLKEIELAFNYIWRFTEKIQETTTTTQINLRLEKIDELWERYGVTLVELKSQDDFDDENDEFEIQRQEFSDRYYQIKLQSFNGEIDEWLSFGDLFTSLIHWKTDLPEVEKLHYLKGCLQGEPKTLIDSLQVTAANYQVAWAKLLKRCNNSKQLKKRQIQSLLKLPILSKESVNELHSLVEGFEKIVQTLDQIVQPVDYKDLLLVNLLTSRLDPSTRRGWEGFSSTQEQGTIKELLEFLQRRVRILESLPSKTADPMKSSNQPQPPRQRSAAVRTSLNTVQASGWRCLACSGNHPLFQCGTFQRMSVTDKDSLLRSHSLCRNCFRQGHQAKECQSKYSCRNCKGRHHTLVCFKPDRDSNSKTSTKGSNVSKGASESNQSSKHLAYSSTPQVVNLAATDSYTIQPSAG
ncbi:uncharacterized protein LOC135708973 [Ochlerotatus camptorhynchus]|uniref:uncharacterized protein LOC135708973 n=1 Tax=Ochlerotatus camptorhynchus TaxID=644619 RepID=UPI0031DB7833